MHRIAVFKQIGPLIKRKNISFLVPRFSVCWTCSNIFSKTRSFTTYNQSEDTDIIEALREKSNGGKLNEALNNLTFDDLAKIADEREVTRYDSLLDVAVLPPSQKNRRQFIDRIKVRLKAGNGGSGLASFLREKYKPVGPPSGGDGGAGGNVYIEANEEETNLINVKYSYNAPSGASGQSKMKHGSRGESLTIKVPVGTIVKIWDEEKKEPGEVIADLDANGAKILVAKGGRGGLGNIHFKSGANRSPQQFQTGTEGEEKTVLLELKTIADIGLVGFPNAGKSTLLSVVSNALPKIAHYAFTTLHPYVGMIEYKDAVKISIADLPGLIEGAHENRGLGHKFLKHVERTKVICYVIDMSGREDREPIETFETLKRELELYNPKLLQLKSMVIANKMDVKVAKDNLKKFIKKFSPNGELPIIPVSAKNKKNIDIVKTTLRKLTESAKSNSIA